jgi:hypothetical protein
MPTTTKPIEESTQTESVSTPTEPLKGDRAIIWKPELDPTCEKQLSSSSSRLTRPFVMIYVDGNKTKLTSASPKGGLIPQFKTFSLKAPGVNWVTCADWGKAEEAGRNYGKSSEEITFEMSLETRLEKSLHHGDDPIAAQLNAGAIVLPALLKNGGQLKGTIEDYTYDGIRMMVESTIEMEQIEAWLRVIQTAIEPHPEKRKIVQFIERTIDTRNGVR